MAYFYYAFHSMFHLAQRNIMLCIINCIPGGDTMAKIR